MRKAKSVEVTACIAEEKQDAILDILSDLKDADKVRILDMTINRLKLFQKIVNITPAESSDAGEGE